MVLVQVREEEETRIPYAIPAGNRYHVTHPRRGGGARTAAARARFKQKQPSTASWALAASDCRAAGPRGSLEVVHRNVVALQEQ